MPKAASSLPRAESGFAGASLIKVDSYQSQIPARNSADIGLKNRSNPDRYGFGDESGFFYSLKAWWLGAESNRRHKDFQSLYFDVHACPDGSGQKRIFFNVYRHFVDFMSTWIETRLDGKSRPKVGQK